MPNCLYKCAVTNLTVVTSFLPLLYNFNNHVSNRSFYKKAVNFENKFFLSTEEIEDLSGRLKTSKQRVTDLERTLSTSSQSSQQLEKVSP